MVFIRTISYFLVDPRIALFSIFAEFSFTNTGGDAITCVMSTPGTCVVITRVVLDVVLPFTGVPLFDVFFDIYYITCKQFTTFFHKPGALSLPYHSCGTNGNQYKLHKA